MRKNPFEVGKNYSRKDVQEMFNIPKDKRKGGNWATGYVRVNKDYFIFANVNTAGRTGHDYANRFIDEGFEWFAKKDTHLGQETIKNFLNPTGNIYIFIRENSSDLNFTYVGNGWAKKYFDETPVRIIWNFKEAESMTGDLEPTFKSSIVIPPLEPSNKGREYKQHSFAQRDRAMYEYLFNGESQRWIDENIFELNPDRHGAAMYILHFIGLRKQHRGIFRKFTLNEAIAVLKEREEDFSALIDCLHRLKTIGVFSSRKESIGYKVSLIIALYLARFEGEVSPLLLLSNIEEAFDQNESKFGMDYEKLGYYIQSYRSYLENRDQPIAWTQSQVAVMEQYGSMSEAALGSIVQELLEKESDLYINPLIERQHVEETPALYTTRGITGKKAEELFQQFYQDGRIIDLDVSLKNTTMEGTGYDFKMSGESGYVFEVKGLRERNGNIMFTDKEWTTAKELRERYFLVVIRNVDGEPEPKVIADPFGKLKPKRAIYETLAVNWHVDGAQLF
ncbi:DUF3427 domain-containing protein [Domibacillus sp.]|uniref:DUF3427 domain-containing protein n=1 Tax=Domibacillus sp. TaxID=1969783 RepID=UPI0035C743F9